MQQAHVLLVEDDSELSGSLGDYLCAIGFETDFALNGSACIELAKHNTYDVIVMDVAMPVLDGLETCHVLRNELNNATPIIFLTARDTLEDKLAGFNAGGDDYLVKPFAPEELVVRLNALLKRRRTREEKVQLIGPLTLDHGTKTLLVNGEPVSLHDIQFRLLQLLSKEAPDPISRERLEAALWEDELPDSDALRTHVYRLRKALSKHLEDELIKTIHGKGYRLAIPS